MSSFRFPFVLLLCAASLARAQTAPSAPPTPPAPPAHNEPVELDHYVVSASPFARNQIDLAQSTTVLGGQELLLKQQPTLGDTLAGEPGMSATSFGAGASRPIIRGLGGDRIRLLENGVGTIDASVTSPDHAVSVEPFLVQRIEVVRGPASLLYGSSAVGGVVNVITHRIETEVPEERVRGGGEVRFGSAADEISRGGLLDVALHKTADNAVVLHLDGFRRETENLRIPGYVESDRLRTAETEEAAEHGEPAPEFARDRLPNSALDSEGGAVGLSFVSKSLSLGASFSGFNTRYGVPGHEHEEEADPEAPADVFEGVRISLRQRRTDVQGEWHNDGGVVSGVRLKFGHAEYRHTEFEPTGEPGTTFTNRGYDARVEVLHREGENASGAVGVQLTRSKFAAVGDEAFLPPSLTRGEAVFAFQELVHGPLTGQFGARLERTRIAPEGGEARSETDPSASLGAVWKIDATWSLAASLAHTERAANAQELYADGAHAGTSSYEIGDPTLGAEKSLGAELSLRRKTGLVTGAVTVFANRFNGFIFDQPTGQVAVEHGDHWDFLPADDPHLALHNDDLPVYRTMQNDARFWGAELETLWHLHESKARQLDLKLAADFTRGRTDDGNLPRIPARRFTVGALWSAGPWNAGVDSQFILDQTRVAANETPTDGYTLLSAYAGYTWATGRAHWQLFARGSNLADEEVRPHTSFVKDLAPMAGRAVDVGVRVMF